jgi:hypothetical protein
MTHDAIPAMRGTNRGLNWENAGRDPSAEPFLASRQSRLQQRPATGAR